MKAFEHLRIRLTAVCALSTALVLVGMAAVSYSFSAGQLRLQYRESFSASCAGIFVYLQEQPVVTHSWLMQTERDNQVWIDLDSGSATLYYGREDPDRERLFRSAKEIAREEHGFTGAAVTYGSPAITPTAFVLEEGQGRYRAAVSSVPGGGGRMTVTVLKDMAPELRQIARLRLAFVASVCGAVACLLVFAWFFSRWAAKPVEESRKRQVAFVGAASHEFRSPVAVIQMGAENIISAPEQAERFAGVILRECSRLGRLTEDMLRLAGADSGNFSIQKAQVSPEAILLTAQEEFAAAAAASAVALTMELPGDPLPKILCDRERVEQVLAILLDNALQYTPQGGTVRLRAVGRKGGVVFSVADSGPGIPDAMKEQVFERFFRGDQSRTGKEHYGLGLSIGSEIAAMHGGRLWVEDCDLGGSEFFLKIPQR